MAISTNGTVIARLAGGLYNTVLSNATYLEVASQDPSTLANTLYTRDFAKSTDLAVATTLVTNLGLSSVAGLANWVAAQLTAAGAANKGAKVVSLLNDFAGMTADTTYGAQATAFNTKVDAALAAAQKTGAVSGVFADAGTVAVANATFTLTSGVDTGAAFTGGAGNDTFTANNAALGVLDSIDGGAGTDTLTVTDSVSIPALNITAAGIETLNVTSTAGSVGAIASDAAVATKQKVVYTFGSSEGTSVGAGPVKVSYGGASQTIANATVGNAVTIRAITAAINDLAGATVATDNTSASTDTTGSITITAPTAGVALPVIAFENGSYKPQGSSTTTTNSTIDVTAATNYSFPVTLVSNQAAADAISSSTFSAPTGVTTFTASAATSANVASVSTAATTVSGTYVTLSSGTSQTVSATDSVKVSGGTGAVDITTKVPATSVAAVSYTGWTAAAGVFARGGTTVKVTETAGTSSSGAAPAGNATAIQIGANPASASGTAGANSGAILSTTSTGYPEKVGNLSSAPTGNVTTSVKTAYTDTSGYKNVAYGTGAVTAYMNGGTTADVTGAGAVTIKDLQSIKLLSSATATAAPGTSTLSTVNLTGVSGSVDLYTDAITNLSILDTAGQTVTINSNTGKNNVALNVSVGNSTPTISASQASSVAFTGITSAYEKVGSTLTTANSGSTTILQAAKATAVSFAGSSDQTLSTSSTLANVTSITSTSSKKVTLGDVTTSNYLPKLSSIDASGATGALSVTIGAPGTSGGTGYGMTVKGGSGADSVTLAAGTSTASVVNVDGATVSTSISLGAGNDKLLNGGTAASSSATLSNTSTIDGGDGTDTISVSLLNSGNATSVKNFETLDLKGAAASGSFDATLLTNSTITGIAISGDIGSAGAFTVSGISGTALAVSVTDTSTTAGSVTAYLATSTGTADTATITYGATSTTGSTRTDATSILTEFKTTGIESVTIASNGTLTNVGDTITNTLSTFKDTSNKTSSITITGSNAFVLGAYSSATSYTDGVEQYTTAPTTAIADANTAAGLTKIDASAATGAVTIVAGETQSDVHGNDGTTNLIFTGLTITGGSGADKLVNLAASGVVNGGDGADAITVTGTAAVVDGGAGNDTITVNAAVSTTLTGGSGTNTFNLTAATAASTTAPKLTTITDYKTTDTLVLGDATPFAKADISSATTLVGAYTAALNGISGTYGGAWFVYGGNTYVCVDADDGGSFSTSDIIVKLTGVFDLSVLSGDATTGLIGLA